MPVKIRLARHGRKARPIYHIVVADSRAPRDGRYIEKLGVMNPNTHPATIDLDFDKALDWLQKGAQPTDTARSILSKHGVLYKKHLLGGVAKGAFSEEEAESRFNTWMKDKEQQNQSLIDKVTKEQEEAEKARLAQESKINEERAAEIAKRKVEAEAAANPPAEEEGDSAEGEEATAEAEAPADVEAEAPATEEEKSEE